MPLEFVKSQKGHNQLIYRGHLSMKERIIDGKTDWKCVCYKKIKCPARVQTLEDEMIKEPGEHNHAPDPAKIAAKKVVGEIKERAPVAQESTHQIVAAATVGLSAAVQGQLPAIPYLKRTVQRTRQGAVGAPPNPRSLEELVIPLEYQQTDHVKSQCLSCCVVC